MALLLCLDRRKKGNGSSRERPFLLLSLGLSNNMERESRNSGVLVNTQDKRRQCITRRKMLQQRN